MLVMSWVFAHVPILGLLFPCFCKCLPKLPTWKCIFLSPLANSLCLSKREWNTSLLRWATVSFLKSSWFIVYCFNTDRLKTFQFQKSNCVFITEDLAHLNKDIVHLLSLRPDSDQILILWNCRGDHAGFRALGSACLCNLKLTSYYLALLIVDSSWAPSIYSVNFSINEKIVHSLSLSFSFFRFLIFSH